MRKDEKLQAVREKKEPPAEVVEQLKKQRKERATIIGQSRVGRCV